MVEGSILYKLAARAESGNPLRIGLIGAGKFGTTFLSQARYLPGLHVLGIADLSNDRLLRALKNAEWSQSQYAATSFENALERGSTYLTDDAESLIKADGIDLIVEATGDPLVGVRYALQAIEYGRHVVMVNVEADALAGHLLARKAAAAGVVYSLAYGDQPALICELVSWARSCGFNTICAGKGTKYLPVYHSSTPDTVWKHYGMDFETGAQHDLNPQMFNSFLDGTKSAIEMAAVSNATGLFPQSEGLRFPPCKIDNLPNICRPIEDGGQLSHKGTVEVVSCMERDGRMIENHLRWGVFIIIEAPSDYVKSCFTEYGLATDTTGRYAAMYRPYHLVGLELSVSILKAGLDGEATGFPVEFNADVIATAKKNLKAKEMLDGEGGYCVYGTLKPADLAVKERLLPIGLANRIKLINDVAEGQCVKWSDIEYDKADPIIKFRREMEQINTTN